MNFGEGSEDARTVRYPKCKTTICTSVPKQRDSHRWFQGIQTNRPCGTAQLSDRILLCRRQYIRECRKTQLCLRTIHYQTLRANKNATCHAMHFPISKHSSRSDSMHGTIRHPSKFEYIPHRVSKSLDRFLDLIGRSGTVRGTEEHLNLFRIAFGMEPRTLHQ